MSQDTHLQLLRLLEDNPRVSQRELAQSLGISLGKANYCLRALIGKGLVKARNFRDSDNKRAYLYVLTPQGIEARARLTARFLARKISEYESLKAEIEQLRREVSTQASDAPEDAF